MDRLAFLLLLVLLSSPHSLLAQRSDSAADSTVRIRFRHGGSQEWTYANLRRADADSLHLQSELGPFSVARADITAAEVSRGRHANVTRGLLIGGGFGVVAGAAAVGVLDAMTEDDAEFQIYVLGAAIGAVPFALLGARTGALTRSERWERVDPQLSTLGVYLGSGAEGTEVGLSLHF